MGSLLRVWPDDQGQLAICMCAGKDVSVYVVQASQIGMRPFVGGCTEAATEQPGGWAVLCSCFCGTTLKNCLMVLVVAMDTWSISLSCMCL